MKITIEAWEKQKISKLLTKAAVAAIAGMLAMIPIAYFFKIIGWGKISIGVIWIPWMIALIAFIPISYHQGVCDERERNKITENNK